VARLPTRGNSSATVTDNYYTNIELANALLDKKTHLIGTLRGSRREKPKNVMDKKVKVRKFSCPSE
jgi:hypothetical protein